jgi:hypothetical protein
MCQALLTSLAVRINMHQQRLSEDKTIQLHLLQAGSCQAAMSQ